MNTTETKTERETKPATGLKSIRIRKTGPVRLTSVGSALYAVCNA
jgi:hypothetical protein